MVKSQLKIKKKVKNNHYLGDFLKNTRLKIILIKFK